MSSTITLRKYIDDYLDERHSLEFLAVDQARYLHSFDRYTQEVGGMDSPTIEMMTAWARQDSYGSKDPLTWARRLKTLRPFMRWFQQFEPHTEVPDDTIFGRLPGRLTPHIYTPLEIVDLLAAAKQLGPEQSLRGKIYEALFGLIACAGLRISEALSLRNVDVDLKHGMITIHQTKFGKTRQLPVHHSTVRALRRYRSELHTSAFCSDDDAPFLWALEGNAEACHWVSVRCIEFSFNFVNTWVGKIGEPTMLPEYTTYATASLYTVFCNGKRKVLILTR